MNRVTIINGKRKFDFGMNQYKLLLGNYYSTKYEIIKSIKRAIIKPPISEYQQYNEEKSEIYVNDILQQPKSMEFISISGDFDLGSDLKMGSKSLSMKYLESKLFQNNFEDEYQTIRFLLDDMLNQISDDDYIKFTSDEFNHRLLTKFVSTLMIRDELQINDFDLDYDEKIGLLLKMIKEICAHDAQKWYFVVFETQHFSFNIQAQLSDCPTNCLIFVVTSEMRIEDKIENVLYCKNKVFDFSDETMIYQTIINNAPMYLEMEVLTGMLKSTFFKSNSKSHEFIINLLE